MSKTEYIETYLNDLFKMWVVKASRWGSGVFVGLSVLDYVAMREHFQEFLGYRIVSAAGLLIASFIIPKMKNQHLIKGMAYLVIGGCTYAIELMILQSGGHTSNYYVGIILLGICILGVFPARFFFHLMSAIIIYSIYLVPILATDTVTDFRTFFTANFFLVSVFITTLFLQSISLKRLMNELNYKYEFELAFKALNDSQQQYRSLVESTEDSVYLVNRDFRYLFMNQKHLSRLGIGEEDYIGKAYSEYHSPEEEKIFIERAEKVFADGESIQYEYQSKKDGRYFLQTLSPVKGSDGKTVAVSVISKDISDRKKMEEELRSLSLTDELTGLYNRRGFFTLFEQQVKMAQRQRKGIHMIYADLDGLKVINDTFGHQTGDRALTETAAILKMSFRESDIIARIGGDEFVIIMVGSTQESIDFIIQRFYKTLEDYNAMARSQYRVSISVGMVYYNPDTPCAVDELLIQADKAMYEEKRKRYV